jgi:HPt (histidine-containing phosphotransfer) domain-containing protein
MDESGGAARVRQQVTELGEKFLGRTQAEAVVLHVLIERIQGGDTSVLPELERMAHKIHGSGAMFGFPAVSECAGEIEHLAEYLMTPQGGLDIPSGQTLHRLRECITHLAHTAEALAGLPASAPTR